MSLMFFRLMYSAAFGRDDLCQQETGCTPGGDASRIKPSFVMRLSWIIQRLGQQSDPSIIQVLLCGQWVASVQTHHGSGRPDKMVPL